jgi:hypothetical protein
MTEIGCHVVIRHTIPHLLELLRLKEGERTRARAAMYM